MGRSSRNISIDLGGIRDDEKRRKGNWKGRLALFAFFLFIGFLGGWALDIRYLSETYFDKRVQAEKIDKKTALLEQKIDSLEKINVKIEGELEKTLDSIQNLSVSECELYLNRRYNTAGK